MLKKWIWLILSSILFLAACHSPVYNQTEGNVASMRMKAIAARKKSDNDAKPEPPLLIKDGLYVDTTPISLEKQPTWLKNHIVIRGDQLPFSYFSRTVAKGANTTILTRYQSGLDPSVSISISYSGTVKGALDLLASRTGYVYSIHGNNVYWQAFITKTYDVAFMPGSTDYLMGATSGSGGTTTSGGGGGGPGGGGGSQTLNYTTSDSSSSEYSSLSGKLSIWNDLQTTISQILSPEGRVTVSQATTSVTVRDRPTNVALIGEYIHNLNHNLAKQVLVKIQVLEVDLQNDFNFGINWQLIAKAFHNSPFMVNGNYGTPVSITSFTGQNANPLTGGLPPVPQFGTQAQPGTIPSYTILLNALNQQGKTSIVSEPRVVCLNNQVSVVRIVSTEGYVASIQNTTLASGGTAPTSTVTSQVTPGSVTTGLTLYILPKILDKDIFMQVNADLSFRKPFTLAGPTNSQIQLPNISEKHFNQRSVIHSGDTLILSGFRQVSNAANASQFLESQALGGQASEQLNAETVVLITPILLNGSA